MALEPASVLSCLLLFLVILATSSLLFFLSSHIHSSKKKSNTTSSKLPPGDLGLPCLGETIQFYGAQRRNRLYDDFILPRARKHGGIFKTRLMGDLTVVVVGAEANRFFLSNEFKLVVSSWPSAAVQLMGNDCIMQKDGGRHRWVRGALAACLTGPALEALVPRLSRSIAGHLDAHWRGRDMVQLFSSVKLLMFSIVLECLFGIRPEPELLGMFQKVLTGVFSPPIDLPGFKFRKAKKARREVGKALVAIVRERREAMEKRKFQGVEEKEGLLLSRLIEGLMAGEIKEEEVVDNLVLLVFAAHDTTAFSIAMMCRMLGQHHDVYSRLLKEHLDVDSSKREEELTYEDTQKMKYTWQVSREAMRLFPPIFGSFRKATVDIDYQGFTIPRGWKVLWTTYGTHYDPQYFEEPLRFDPSRFDESVAPYVYIPFGGGPRLCVGYQLARLNILIFIHIMVTRYEWSLIDPQEPITVDPLPFPSKGMPIKISEKRLQSQTNCS